MTRFIHLSNALAWFANAVLLGFYAGSWFMAAVSMGAVVLSYQMARWDSEQWR